MWYDFSKYGMATKTEASDAADAIRDCDYLVIGIGAGLSAAGGQNYEDEELVKQLHPFYHSLGYKTELQLIHRFWSILEMSRVEYWGFWAKHIHYMRYRDIVLQPYADLAKFAKNKNYYIITTNYDSQVDKAGFDKDRIFAPQGNYAYFQCLSHCTDEIYYNKEMIDKMLESMGDGIRIHRKDIPRCPHCRDYLVPNQRNDDTFVEKPHMANLDSYCDFVIEAMNSGKNVVFLELGVGFTTPIIIRFQFDELARRNPKATLIRVNNGVASVPKEAIDHSISIKGDLTVVMSEISKLI